MFKGFRVLEKSSPPKPVSVLLEHKSKEEALLFESRVVAVLCKFQIPVSFVYMYMTTYINCSCTRNRIYQKELHESVGCIRMSGCLTVKCRRISYTVSGNGHRMFFRGENRRFRNLPHNTDSLRATKLSTTT